MSPFQEPIQICVGSAQNAFFVELAHRIEKALTESGQETILSFDKIDKTPSKLLFLSPYEFMLTSQLDEREFLFFLGSSVCVTAEQPGLSEFAGNLRFARAAGAVMDLNRLGVGAYQGLGIAASQLTIGSKPRLVVESPVERDLDVVIFAAETSRRLEFLGEASPFLSELNCVIQFAREPWANAAGTPGYLSSNQKRKLLQRAKVMISFRRSTVPYFELLRYVDATENGCAYLCEPCIGFEPYTPGKQFAIAEQQHLEARLRSLLDGEWTGMAEVARSSLVPEGTMANQVIAAFAKVPTWSGKRNVSLSPRTRGDVIEDLLDLQRTESRDQQLAHSVRTVLRRRGLDNAATNLIEARIGSISNPSIAVVVPLFNQARYVGECVESIAEAASNAEAGVEVIVLNDASTDRPNEIVLSALRALPLSVSWKYLENSVNRGLPATRNVAFEIASPGVEFVIPLDADNVLHRFGIRRLHSAIGKESSAAFAYGLLWRFDDQGVRTGAMGVLPWDPALLMLENYVDALSIVRRSRFVAAGGYTTDARFYGWEDFELWLRMGSRGEIGVHVPNFVGGYRVNADSMISDAQLGSGFAKSLLVEKFRGPIMKTTKSTEIRVQRELRSEATRANHS